MTTVQWKGIRLWTRIGLTVGGMSPILMTNTQFIRTLAVALKRNACKMNGKEKPIPQVGPGVTGESHPALYMAGCSTDSGGSKHAERRELLRRGLTRSYSVGGADRKRKERTSEGPQMEPYKRQKCPAVFTLQEAIAGISKAFKEMEQFVELKNTKTEIKEKSSILRKYINTLNKDIIRNFIQENQFEKLEKMTYDADVQVDMHSETEPKTLMDEIQRLREENKNTKKELEKMKLKMEELERSKLPEKQVGAVEIGLENIIGINSFEEYKRISIQEWGEHCFTNVRIQTGNPLQNTDEGCPMVLVHNDDRQMNESIQKLYRDRYPELMFMNKEVDKLDTISSRTDDSSQTIETKRTIIKVNTSGEERELYERFVTVKEIIDKNNLKKTIITHRVKGIDLGTQRKLAQAVFKDGQYQVIIYIAKHETKGMNNKRKTKTETIYIKQKEGEQKSYAETLRKLRGSIDVKAIGAGIYNVKKTEKGIEIRVSEKSKGATEALIQEINNIVGEERAERRPEKEKAIIIKDLDETMDKEEIETAVKRACKDDNMKITMIGPRNYDINGKRGTAIVIVKETNAEKLLKLKRIDLGWERCRVEEKVTLDKCYKCQEFGHKLSQCKKEAVKRKCLKCGDEGHITSKCEATEMKCYICGEMGEKGHRADSMKCKVYREMVYKKKEREAGNKEMSHVSNAKSLEKPTTI